MGISPRESVARAVSFSGEKTDPLSKVVGPERVRPTPADVEQRWSDAITVARMHDIECTGGMDPERECTEPGALPLIVYGRLYAIACKRHGPPLLQAILLQGIAAVTTVPLVELVEIPDFKSTAEKMRERNLQHGVILPRPT